MRKIILMIAVMMLSFFMTQGMFAVSPVTNDSTPKNLNLKALKIKKDSLQKAIKVEDSKRNRQIAGVSPETMERINIRQDSICLALRSELTDLNLEIREASAAFASPHLINQFNNLAHRTDSLAQPAASSSAPASTSSLPSKPTKPAKKVPAKNKK